MIAILAASAQGSGVLDVAGGKGAIAVALIERHGISATVIDPLTRRGTAKGAGKKRARPRIIATPFSFEPEKMSAPEASVWAEAKCSVRVSNSDRSARTGAAAAHAENIPDCDQSSSASDALALVASLLKSCACVVAMHPDEATDSVMDAALACNKPFAVVPCCVFASKFSSRRLPARNLQAGPDMLSDVAGDDRSAPKPSRPVETYEELLEYLEAKHPRIERAFLPFEGRRVVLFMRPRTPSKD